jgi:hypothetical protein
LVPAGDAESLSARLIEILSADPATYRQLVERCQQTAKGFSWPMIARDTIARYQTHLARVR